MVSRKKPPTAQRLYTQYISGCKRRNIYWELTPEYFSKLTKQDCAYCGVPPLQKMRGYTYNGIDRKDDDMGYTDCNTVPCCGECNFIKGCRLTFDEMKAIGKTLAILRKSKIKAKSYKKGPKKKS